MSYASTTDFLALLRQTTGGLRSERMPGLDWLIAALVRAGMLNLSVSLSAPTTHQTITAWFKPASPSWTAEGALFLWNIVTSEYEPATPALWSNLFVATASGSTTVQDVTTVGPVPIQGNASVVRVQNVGAPVTLTMPLAATMAGPVLISDWANSAGTNPITINTTGGEVFPGGVTTWQIGADTGSVFLRPVPGGYAL